MADRPPYSDSSHDPDDDPDLGLDRELTTGAPRWVKVFVIIALVLTLLLVVLLFSGGGPGGHGPSRHASSGDVAGHTPPTGGYGSS